MTIAEHDILIKQMTRIYVDGGNPFKAKEQGVIGSITAAVPLIVEAAPTLISGFNKLRESFARSERVIEASSDAIAHASESPEQLRAALEALKAELLALNDRTEELAGGVAEIARANQVAVQTIALQQRWLAALSLAVVLAIGLALGALLAG